MHVRKCNKDFNNHRKSKMEGVQSEMNKKTCFRKSERNVLMQNKWVSEIQTVIVVIVAPVVPFVNWVRFSHFWHLYQN